MLKKLLLPILFLQLLPVNHLFSQTVEIPVEESDLIRVARDLDSLVSSWQIRMALGERGVLRDGYSGEVIHEFSDSVYIDRLSRINTLFQLPYNSIIRNHIHVYTRRQHTNFSVILGLQDYYFPMIEDIFDSYGVPTELKYMAVIESALNPNAVSRAGATGLWQFMYSTGRMYGLTINSVVDERRDPVKATHAAARYLLDLHRTYNDWFLALAAYNCGPGNVNKAIARSGNKRDYWEIYNRLPRETRGYIPQYIAAMYAMNYHHKHNIVPAPLNLTVSRDTIVVNRDIHFRQIEAVTGMSYNELRALNPQYRTGLVPGRTRPSHITLPTAYLSVFIINQDSIENYRANVFLATATPASATSSTYIPPDIAGKTRLVYSVKSGDNLGFISEWYNVRAADLRHWNNLSGSTIYINQKLTVFVDNDKVTHYTRIDNMSFAEKQALRGRAVATDAPATTRVQPPVGTAIPPELAIAMVQYDLYTVRRDDTIWDIAKLFDGVSVDDILKLNNLPNANRIRIGQELKIPVRR